MATATRQPKPTRKGPVQDPARRPPAWSDPRASPTFASGRNSPRPTNGPPPGTQGGFSPAHPNGARTTDTPHDRVLQSIAGLTGTTITLLTKTGQHYEGVVASTNGEGDTTGVTLKDVKEISNPGAPLKTQLFIAATNIDNWSSGPADAKLSNGDTFRTDADIAKLAQGRRDRELQAWQPATDPASTNAATAAPLLQLSAGDEVTFGPGSNNTSWDQFAANMELFGVSTKFDEDAYTTKLDRSAADFKERERKAQKIANEIIGATTNNPHIAEERNINLVDDSGVNEEDKYGAVVRGSNAYVPPGARRQNTTSPPVPVPKPEVPVVSVNAPDGAVISQPLISSPSSSSKAPSPAPTNPNKPPADPLPAFRDFVTNEKQRLNQKRQALVKSEMDKRMAELVKFSQSFKLNKPIPDDLVPILAKDEEKQKQIREKASKDASSAHARSIGASSSVVNAAPSANRAPQPTMKLSPDLNRKTGAAAPNATKMSATNVAVAAAAAAAAAPVPTKAGTNPTQPPKVTTTTATTKPAINMFIQPIPPFKGSKSRPQHTSSQSNGDNVSVPNNSSQLPASNSTPAVIPSTPASPTTASNKQHLNPKASAFSPVRASPSPNPITGSGSGSVSSKPKTESTPPTPNPFFGTRPIKKSPPVNIKDDFNPFKHGKNFDASAASAVWPYSGKRYMHMFSPPQFPPPQHSPHVAPPGPPPMPPPSYEEDSAAQAAARGYVYAYPPYGYPAQHMMPGMPPPPPGAYMPGPFMQPMPYPPGMVPPNGQPMYSPGIGQMPPYMPQPPPGSYPPPPNGAAPRPSMPPTPIPAHAHPYYHQSPQLQHAVPYPMMMPPPAPNVAPHVYDGGPAPPVQMGHT